MPDFRLHLSGQMTGNFIKIASGCCAVTGLGLTVSTVSAAEARKPNIVFILADDLGYGDLSVYNPSGKIRTPVLDSLAKDGIRFTNAHSSAAVSTPTRYGLLTGRYPWRSGLKAGVLWTWAPPLLTDEYTLPEMLRSRGYKTGLVGKWHLGISYSTFDGNPADAKTNGANVDYSKPILDGPLDHGFEYYYGDDVPDFPPYTFIENDMHADIPDVPFPENGMPGVPGVMSPDWRPEKLLETEADKAVGFIKKNRNKSFFLMVTLTTPHTPIAPTAPFVGSSAAGRYGDFVQEMDSRIGDIIDELKKCGLYDDTIIVFSSDNGSSFQDGGNESGGKYGGKFGSILEYGHSPSGNFRGLKSDAYEGGHRIPFIVKLPDNSRAGTVSDALICDLDLYATLDEMTEACGREDRRTDNGNGPTDSRSFADILYGKSDVSRANLVTQSGNGVLSYYEDGWKLITSSGSGGSINPYDETGETTCYDDSAGVWRNVQLYNLAADQSEHFDLGAQCPGKVREMLEALAGVIGKTAENDSWEQVEWMKDLNPDRVTADTGMIGLLCPPGKNIFTGSDGAISIPVGKDTSVWIFGDSFMGEVVDNRRDSLASPLIYGNIFVELAGGKARTICGGTPENPSAVVPCDSINGKQAVYWPHHGFVRNGILHTYMIKIVFDPELWFYTDGLSYIRLRLPEYEIIDQTEVSSFNANKIWYGWGFFEQDGYYYTYGGSQDRDLFIARGRLADDRLCCWEYFDGNTWSPDPAKARKLDGLDVKISTQFSVFPYNDKYILLTQDGDSLSDDIYSFVADSPTGPWYNKKLLYSAPEPKENDALYSYNAMAHPQYSRDGKLLVSYCINSKKPELLWQDASIYRPRFLWVPYSLILPQDKMSE